MVVEAVNFVAVDYGGCGPRLCHCYCCYCSDVDVRRHTLNKVV
jgi:hypothetical protein